MSPVPVGRRTAVALALASAVGLVAFAWPLVAAPDGAVAHAQDAPVVLAGVLVAVLAVLAVALGDGGIDAKGVATLGLLSAVGALLRPLSAGAAGVELVFLTIVLGGRVFGAGFGFALGSTTLATSALITGGVGPWLPFQMLAASWIGMGAGLLPRRARGGVELALVAAYGAVASMAFGLVMTLSFWPFGIGGGTELSFVAGDAPAANLHRLVLFWLVTSLGWDVGRAVTTAVGLALVGRPVLRVLRRAAARARFESMPPRVRPGDLDGVGVSSGVSRRAPDPSPAVMRQTGDAPPDVPENRVGGTTYSGHTLVSWSDEVIPSRAAATTRGGAPGTIGGRRPAVAAPEHPWEEGTR